MMRYLSSSLFTKAGDSRVPHETPSVKVIMVCRGREAGSTQKVFFSCSAVTDSKRQETKKSCGFNEIRFDPIRGGRTKKLHSVSPSSMINNTYIPLPSNIIRSIIVADIIVCGLTLAGMAQTTNKLVLKTAMDDIRYILSL